MKHKIARIILIAFAVIIVCVLLFACGSKSTKAESSHAELYSLYVLDSDNPNGLILYNNYKVKPEDVYDRQFYGDIQITYYTTDGTRIIVADNGVTVISPKGYTESFTQGYMRRIGEEITYE